MYIYYWSIFSEIYGMEYRKLRELPPNYLKKISFTLDIIVEVTTNINLDGSE